MKELNEQTFDQAISASPLVVVDFFATWCGPCKMLAPILESVEKETEGVAFFRVDVDQAPDLARRFGIMSIPTLIFFRDGNEFAKTVGVLRKPDLLAKINELKTR